METPDVKDEITESKISGSDNIKICKSCGNAVSGKYCSVCGEKVFSESDLSFKKYIAHSIDVLTHFDSKLLKSVKLLVTKPGELTLKYCTGKRISFAKPMQLFLVINVIYFITISFWGFNTFNSPLWVHLNASQHSELAKQMVSDKVTQKNISVEEYAKIFNEKVHIYSKSLIIIMILLLALFFSLLYFRQKRYFTEHLVFATHFFSWLLLFKIIFEPLEHLLFLLLSRTGLNISFADGEAFWGLQTAIFVFLYLSLAIKRFYDQSWLVNILKSAVATYSLLYIVFIYRFILFLIVFYMT